MVTANSQILSSETYKVLYEKGYGFLIAFPPQMYELLKRYSPKLSSLKSYSQTVESTAASTHRIPSSQSSQRLAGAGVTTSSTQSLGPAKGVTSVKKPGISQQSL